MTAHRDLSQLGAEAATEMIEGVLPVEWARTPRTDLPDEQVGNPPPSRYLRPKVASTLSLRSQLSHAVFA